MTSKIKVTGGVSNPIVRAYAVETKGASGLVVKTLPTFFESSDQNLTTQTVKDPQITSNTRAVVLITLPQQLSIQICPVNL